MFVNQFIEDSKYALSAFDWSENSQSINQIEYPIEQIYILIKSTIVFLSHTTLHFPTLHSLFKCHSKNKVMICRTHTACSTFLTMPISKPLRKNTSYSHVSSTRINKHRISTKKHVSNSKKSIERIKQFLIHSLNSSTITSDTLVHIWHPACKFLNHERVVFFNSNEIYRH